MKRWQVEYDREGSTRTHEFEHDGTPTLEDGAREVLRHLRNSDVQILPVDQPRVDGENTV